MGMTIDEALKVWLPIIRMGVETMPECKEALDMAINSMRKYQKIVDIVSLNDEEFKQCGLKELKEILEVIADGNKNNHHASDC